jgi:hypothetical protein
MMKTHPSHDEDAPSHDEDAPSHDEDAPSHDEGPPSPESVVKRVFEPTPPESPVPREGSPGRPVIQDTTRHDTTQLAETPGDSGSLVTSSHVLTAHV